MKNEITNTGKPALQSGEQAPKDKTSKSKTQDDATLMRRRRLLKGLGAAPLVITLHNGAAMASSSTGGCVGQLKPTLPDDGCVAGTPEDHDSFLRTTVTTDGRVIGHGWDANEKHPYYTPGSDRNQCLLSVNQDGDIHVNAVYDDSLVTNSCWCSFT